MSDFKPGERVAFDYKHGMHVRKGAGHVVSVTKGPKGDYVAVQCTDGVTRSVRPGVLKINA